MRAHTTHSPSSLQRSWLQNHKLHSGTLCFPLRKLSYLSSRPGLFIILFRPSSLLDFRVSKFSHSSCVVTHSCAAREVCRISTYGTTMEMSEVNRRERERGQARKKNIVCLMLIDSKIFIGLWKLVSFSFTHWNQLTERPHRWPLPTSLTLLIGWRKGVFLYFYIYIASVCSCSGCFCCFFLFSVL